MLSRVTERRTLRRLDVLPFLLAGLLIAGMPVAVAVNWPLPRSHLVIEIGATVAFTVFCYLIGPAAAFVVTPTEVVVENILVRYAVPRHLVDFVEVRDIFGVFLATTDGHEIPIRAALPAGVRPSGGNLRGIRSRARELTDLMKEVPRAPSTGSVERRWRVVNVALAVADLAAAVVIATYAFSMPA
jgi:hypothetical protein